LKGEKDWKEIGARVRDWVEEGAVIGGFSEKYMEKDLNDKNEGVMEEVG